MSISLLASSVELELDDTPVAEELSTELLDQLVAGVSAAGAKAILTDEEKLCEGEVLISTKTDDDDDDKILSR